MPNIVAHILVADTLAPQANLDYKLGSAMPDFVGMAKDFRGATTTVHDLKQNSLLSEGVALHIATDNIYDQLPESRGLIMQAQADLGHISLSRGALKICADAGTEILLDGVIIEEGHNSFYNKVQVHVNNGNSALNTIDDPELVSLVREYFADNRAARYKDPEVVATMLQYRLECRKKGRYGFGVELIPEVTKAFVKQQDRLRQCSKQLIQLTVDGLRDAQTLD